MNPTLALLLGLVLGINIGGLLMRAADQKIGAKVSQLWSQYAAPDPASSSIDRIEVLLQQARSHVDQLTTKNAAAAGLVQEIRETGDLASRRSDEGIAPRRTVPT